MTPYNVRSDAVLAGALVLVGCVSVAEVAEVFLSENLHTVALLPEGSHSTMAQTGVSGPVVVDGESFSDALFASAGQG